MRRGLPIVQSSSSWFPCSSPSVPQSLRSEVLSTHSAWTPSSIPTLMDSQHRVYATRDALRVRVIRSPRHIHSVFETSLLTSLQKDGTTYLVEPVTVSCLENLEWRCDLNTSRVIVVDSDLLRAEPEAFRHIWRRTPGIDWLVAGDKTVAEQIDPMNLKVTRGFIGWTCSQHQFLAALDAVSSGKLWFPRSVIERLFLLLVEGREPEQIMEGAKPCAPGLLTDRETEVFGLMHRGMTNRQIAERLGVSANTVKKHVANVLEKRGMHGRRQAIM